MTAHEPVSTTVGMPMVEFVRLFEQEGPFELVDGERLALMPGVAEHAEIIKLVYAILLAYEQRTRQVAVYAETAYVLTLTPDWVTGARIPDLMAYETARLMMYKTQVPDWRKKPFVLVPDLCVEVISPNDIYTEVDEKVERYLTDGVRLIWVINPRANSVRVHTAGSNQITRLTHDHTLDGGDVLPDFEVAVHEIFPA